MKMLRRLALVLLFGCAAPALADDTQPALYSFADLYRLSVSAPAPSAQSAFAEPQLRLAAEGDALAAPTFLVSPVSGPGRWALVLAGLAAAGWVAHRRLAFPY
jgi:hypothetical protein